MLRNLVRDLSWLAESDSGELRLNRESCPVSELLGAEVGRWPQQARMRRIDLALQVRPGLPTLKLDRMRISQALGNVLHNALQHTGAGGRITVTADLETGGRVAIAVSDDGAGIDGADLPHLFDRLYRADEIPQPPHRRRRAGTGDRIRHGRRARRHDPGGQRRTGPGDYRTPLLAAGAFRAFQ